METRLLPRESRCRLSNQNASCQIVVLGYVASHPGRSFNNHDEMQYTAGLQGERFAMQHDRSARS